MTRIGGVGRTGGAESAAEVEAAAPAESAAATAAATPGFKSWSSKAADWSGDPTDIDSSVTLRGHFSRSVEGEIAVWKSKKQGEEIMLTLREGGRAAPARPLTIPEMKDLKAALEREAKSPGRHARALDEIISRVDSTIGALEFRARMTASDDAGGAGRDIGKKLVSKLADPDATARGVGGLLAGVPAGKPKNDAEQQAVTRFEAGLDQVLVSGKMRALVERLGASAQGKAELKHLEAAVKKHGSEHAQAALAAAKTADPTSDEPSVAAPRTAALGASDPLRKKAAEIDERWGDDNIASGSQSLTVGAFPGGAPSGEELRALAAKVLRKGHSELGGVAVPKGALRTAIGPFDDTALQLAATRVSDAFAYSRVDAGIKKDLKAIAELLGPREDLVLARSEGYVLGSVDDSAEPSTAFVLVNKRTGKFAEVFSSHGDM